MAVRRKRSATRAAPRRRRMTFALHAPGAAEVALAGDFNGWDVRRHPMKKEPDGKWQKIVMLYPGRYEYKFFVDGRWQSDPAGGERQWNRFGTRNNVIEVRAR